MFIGDELIKMHPGARIIESRITGPSGIGNNTQVGPDVVAGKFFGMNVSCFVARAKIGAYCAFGARTSINPFNHPIDWLSIHDFQYHPLSYSWAPEYKNFQRLERTPDMIEPVSIGSDVWTGHNVNIMAGVNVGHGAVIGAGSVVTRDVPPYAIMAGVPAKLKRYRFSEKTIERLLRVQWWDMELSQLSGLPFRNIEQCLTQIEEIKARDSGTGEAP